MKDPCANHSHSHRHRLIQPALNELTDQLRRNARKITAPRQAILNVLRRHQHPLTNREIHAALYGFECDLATVYRNLNTLEDMGMVRRFDFGDGTARFELVTEGDDGHHHHLVCTRCGSVEEVEDCFPAELEAELARKHGFQQVSHKLEFFGICPKCQPRRAGPSA
jgi:Fur family ferric uptake transcriptional regulator